MTRRSKSWSLGSVLVAGLAAGCLMVGMAGLAGAPAVAADVSVGVGPGGIAFGYADGYWDRGHNWHAWRNHEEMEHWRAENREHYYAWNHDRDHDHGWRDKERYWEHH
ncbi:MAG TPA: hypothetical protein VMB81_02870 [Candidatus Sulfotelmatobacter sp.]|nr:hypothetical protein [Candidatus Sulfotelmatobacter sp.]